jgi:hypothetical protein
MYLSWQFYFVSIDIEWTLVRNKGIAFLICVINIKFFAPSSCGKTGHKLWYDGYGVAFIQRRNGNENSGSQNA